MKSLSNFLHATPWWAMLLGGVAAFVALAVFVTPFHLIKLQKSGASPAENRAIKREVDLTFSEGAVDLAGGIVKEIRDHTRDPVRRESLDRALEEIETARQSLREAGAEVLRAKRGAAQDVANAMKDASKSVTDAHQDAARALKEAGVDSAKQEKKRIVIISPFKDTPSLDIEPGDRRDAGAVLAPGAPLPPEVRAQIREKVTRDLRRIGLGTGLIVIFIPLFILAVISKFFIDRSRSALQLAELKRKEAEYHLMSRQVTEAKLAALQAQVEPHFLYNTLASVQALIEVDPQQARAMTDHLIQYLRNALPKMRESGSTVGQEIELVRAYLNILQMRMGKRLSFEISVPPELMDAPFPPLMLPSLVENAIKHGLEPQREGGEVRIAAEASEGKLRLTVSDTGRGFEAVPGTGVGLTNLRERLAAMYGAAAGLTLAAREPHGVIATIEVPRDATRAPGSVPPTEASTPSTAPVQTEAAPGAATRTLAAMGSLERAWRKGLTFTFSILVVAAAVAAGLAILGVMTGALPMRVGHAAVGSAAGAFLGTAGIAIAFAVLVLALAIVLAVVYGLGFLFLALAIFVPLVVLVALFPVLSPFLLLGLGVWWLVRRHRRKAAANAGS